MQERESIGLREGIVKRIEAIVHLELWDVNEENYKEIDGLLKQYWELMPEKVSRKGELALELFARARKALNTSANEKEWQQACLDFVSALVEVAEVPNNLENAKARWTMRNTAYIQNALTVVKGDLYVPLASGTAGCRIHFNRDRQGVRMDYSKPPLGSSWALGRESWAQFRLNFSSDSVRLEEAEGDSRNSV